MVTIEVEEVRRQLDRDRDEAVAAMMSLPAVEARLVRIEAVARDVVASASRDVECGGYNVQAGSIAALCAALEDTRHNAALHAATASDFDAEARA